MGAMSGVIHVLNGGRGGAYEMRRAVNGKSGKHYREAGERLHRPVDDERTQDEGRHEQENDGRDGIAPGAIGPRQVGMGVTQLDDAKYGEEGADRQAELDEVEHR